MGSENLLAPRADKYGVYTATLNNRLNSKRTIKMAIRRDPLSGTDMAFLLLVLPNLPPFSLFHQTPRATGRVYVWLSVFSRSAELSPRLNPLVSFCIASRRGTPF